MNVFFDHKKNKIMMTKINILLLPAVFTPSLALTFAPNRWQAHPASSLNYREGATEPLLDEVPDTAKKVLALGDDNAKASVFKPWPFGPKVEAHGDYASDTYIEEHVGGPLYRQDELPKLPLQSVKETIDRLLPTVLPLATNDEEKEDFLQACKDFSTEAEVLHERLNERKNKEYANSSWLQAWWQTQAYMQYRNPLAHYVSYYLMVPDDAQLATDQDAGIKRGAAILHNVAESRKQICSGSMPAETMAGDALLCSAGFKYMFHASRIPTAGQDIYHLYDPSRSRHAVVAVGGQFFAVDIADDQEDPLPLPLLEARLRECRELALASSDLPQLGWCTSMHRDEWTEIRNELASHDSMANALETMESAAFVLNLDDEEPETLIDAAPEFWNGGAGSGANRWFDKPMQILVTKNGHVAYQGEHSMLDAAPVISVIRRIVKTTYSRLAKRFDDYALDEQEVKAGVSNVFGGCWSDHSLLKLATDASDKARQHHAKLCSEFDVKAVQFGDFGKKKVKKYGFDGPLFAQMAIQLAGYRLFGEMVACYEAAATRSFLHGRTEATRPVSPETLDFVQTMENDQATPAEKVASLKAAASTIGAYQGVACAAKGVDRHLFGLSNMVQEGEEAPKLFADPLFQRSKKFRLSTSSVVFTPGFGPVEDDGLGIGFNAEKDAFIFTVTSRAENNYVGPFCSLIEEALREMSCLLDSNAQEDES